MKVKSLRGRVPPSANQFSKSNQLSNLRRVPKLELGTFRAYSHQRPQIYNILWDHYAGPWCAGSAMSRSCGKNSGRHGGTVDPCISSVRKHAGFDLTRYSGRDKFAVPPASLTAMESSTSVEQSMRQNALRHSGRGYNWGQRSF